MPLTKSQQIFKRGMIAFHQGVRLESCQHVEFKDRLIWKRGWMHAKKESQVKAKNKQTPNALGRAG